MMTTRWIAGAVALLLAAGSAAAQLDKPLPQALTGEANRAYEALMAAPTPEPAFAMPARVEFPIWFRAEALLAWSAPQTLPPLLTTSPPGTPRETAGILGSPGTSVLVGGDAGNSFRTGFAVGFGVQPFSDYSAGLELGFSRLARNESVFTDASDGSRILGRPFTDADTGQGQAVQLAFPGFTAGTFEARASSGNLYLSNITLTDRVLDTGACRVTLLAGYRRYDMQEELLILSQRQGIDPNFFVPGTTIRNFDRFATNGTFHGADLGVRGEVVEGPFAVEVLARMAFGRLTRAVDITGNQVINVPGAAPVVSPSSFLALVSNSGRRTSDSAQVLPEFGAVGKWQISRRAELRLGYSTYLLQGVARAADQIDTTISTGNFEPFDPNFPQGPRPAFNLRTSNIWVGQLSLGLTVGF